MGSGTDRQECEYMDRTGGLNSASVMEVESMGKGWQGRLKA